MCICACVYTCVRVIARRACACAVEGTSIEIYQEEQLVSEDFCTDVIHFVLEFAGAVHLDGQDHRERVVGRRRERRIIDRLDDVAEKYFRAERMPVSDHRLVAGVAVRNVLASVPAVELDASAPFLQHKGILLRGRVPL